MSPRWAASSSAWLSAWRIAEVGKPAQHLGHALQRPQAEDVGEGHGQRDPSLVSPEGGHEALAAAEQRVLGLLDQAVDRLIRSLGQHPAQHIGLGEQEFAEIGAVAEDRGQRAAQVVRGIRRAVRSTAPGAPKRARPRSAAASSPTRGNAVVSIPEPCVTFRLYLNEVKLGKVIRPFEPALIRTISHRFLRLLAVLVTVLTVAVALFAWRIASGPLALDWLTPTSPTR